MIDDFDEAIIAAMKVLSRLSDEAKASGDSPTMYAVNRAWHELHRAQQDRERRKTALKTEQGETK